MSMGVAAPMATATTSGAIKPNTPANTFLNPPPNAKGQPQGDQQPQSGAVKEMAVLVGELPPLGERPPRRHHRGWTGSARPSR